MSSSPTPRSSDQSRATSTSLLERVKGHDEAAWGRLVQVYSPLIYHWCRSAGLKPDDAADVLQDIFCAVAKGIDCFRRDSDKDSFRGWLRIITRNRLSDHFRRQQGQFVGAGGTNAQQQLHAIRDPLKGVDETSSADEQSIVFQNALAAIRAEFEDRTWQAFWQVTVEEREFAEVAAALRMSTNAVYKAKSRILRRLREEMGELLD